MTLACIISAIVTLGLLVTARTSEITNQTLLTITKGLAFACLIMGIIGVAVGINAITGGGSGLSMGAGAILGILAIIINLGGAIVAVLVK